MTRGRISSAVTSHRSYAAAIGLALLALLSLPVGALAAAPAQLWQTPVDGEAGSGAGQMIGPESIAADPLSGHVYVGDSNARVNEFDAWGEFVKAWGWGVRNGAAELQTCGPGANPPSATCLAGIPGSGPGQFGGGGEHRGPRGGIVVDAAGNVYVADMEVGRVQKFDSAGNFLLAFGTPGEGDGQFAYKGFGNHMAIGPAGTIFVGDSKGRIQEFDPNGAFKSKVTLEGELAGHAILSLAIDSSGNFHVIAAGDNGHIYKFSPTGALLSTITVELQLESPLALDGAGNLYAAAREQGSERREVVEFDSAGSPVISPGSGFAVHVEGYINGLTTNTVTTAGGTDIYVAGALNPSVGGARLEYLSAYGPPPDKWAPPTFPPEILSQYAISVDADRAVVGAQINPRFWADTSYYVEWGTGKCSEGGCTEQQPAPPGAELGAGIVNSVTATKSLALRGLLPDTTYHYRFVAQSSGGGPVHGVGPAEAEAAFHTPPPSGALSTSCPNQAFRTAASAKLPDCRAYEMVTPIEKNNTDIVSLINNNSNPAALNQSAGAGDALTYTTSQGFGDSQGVPYVSQYIASRGAEGWQSHGITPPQGLAIFEISGRIDVEFRAFTEDLCDSALFHVTDPPLAPGAVEGYANIYRRHNCAPGADAYEAVSTAKPPNRPAASYPPGIQGLSADGRCTVFYAEDQLTPDANPGGPPDPPDLPFGGSNRQLYESCGGELRLVSALPNGKASTSGSSVGTSDDAADFRGVTDAQAFSADGSRVYWTDALQTPGKIYLRINADQAQSEVAGGKCSEEEKACTIKVSQTVSSAAAHFWGASVDGSRALFTIQDISSPANGNLYEFELESGKSTLIASGVSGVMGVGGEAMRAYFVSKGALSSANAEGHSPVAGQPNLYLYEKTEAGPALSFIGTLSAADAEVQTLKALTPVNREPFKKTSRLSPDGRHAAFMSRAPLTGYDNTDKANGQADAEVFTYDADAGELACVSCNPSGQRPAGRGIPVEGEVRNENWAAALLPTYESSLYGSRVISDDGSRVYFNSYEALLPRDTNGKADVYQWEAPGSGDCTESAPAFSALNNGCLSLISSGESPTDSEFVDASRDGKDVFFATGSSLLPQDVGLIDVYDAREDGGYPPPPGIPPACEGEACQGPLAPPNDPTPGSSSYNGPGNPPLAKKQKKAKHKAKKRQKKAAKKKQRRAAGNKGRAGR